ncbi:hypothetical protein C0993_008965 [Termitomyces sp. T159_Od127]|nr:hypothetical protein C0993_008965 [Termitomyces sp. T159_Od127]
MAVSPLLLLSSRNLQNNPLGKEALFNYERPKSVLSAKKELWNVIWDIAAGMGTYNCLRTAIDRLLELDFEDVGEWELAPTTSSNELPISTGTTMAAQDASATASTRSIVTPNRPSTITATLSLDNQRPEQNSFVDRTLAPPGSELARELTLAEEAEAALRFCDIAMIDQMLALRENISGPGPFTENDEPNDDSSDDDDVIFLGIVKPKKVILQNEVNLLDLASFETDLDWIYDIYGSADLADNQNIDETSSIVHLTY